MNKEKSTLGARIDTVLYDAFNVYCKRQNTTVSLMLSKLVIDCIKTEWPDHEWESTGGTLVQNQDVINFLNQRNEKATFNNPFGGTI